MDQNNNIEDKIFLDPKRRDILNFIDSWNDKDNFCHTKPSILLKGGWYAMNKDSVLSNPDWMAQSANSFREVHYKLSGLTLWGKIINILKLKSLFNYRDIGVILKLKNKKDYISITLKDFVLEEDSKQELANLIYNLHICFTKISHHYKEKDSEKKVIKNLKKWQIKDSSNTVSLSDYEGLVRLLESSLLRLIPSGLDGHVSIDNFIKINTNNTSNSDVKQLRTLIIDPDAKNYFFSKIDHTWYRVLKDNNFLDLSILPKDVYHLPEIGYINRLVEISPESFIDLLDCYSFNTTDVSVMILDNLHRDICYHLSVDFLDKMVEKMKNEEWVYLMRNIHQSSYEYSDLIKKINTASKYDVLLNILEILFTPVKSSDVKQDELGDDWYSFPDKLFYIDNLSDSEIIDILIDHKNPIKEKTLKTILEIFQRILNIEHRKKNSEKVFEKPEPFYLPQLNIFKSNIQKSKISSREDVESVIIMLRKILDIILVEKVDDIDFIKNLEEMFTSLPYTYSSWRLKLYLITRRPDIFSEKIKIEFNKVLDNIENYYDLTSGAEFHQALIDSFELLDQTYKKDYIDKVIEGFSKSQGEEFVKREGVQILKIIESSMTEDQKNNSSLVFGKIFDEFNGGTPTPRSSYSEGGMVSDISPIDNMSTFSVLEIMTNLKSVWTPEELSKKYKDDPFLNPRNASGLARKIAEDMKSSDSRLGEYLDNLSNLIEPNIPQIYIYHIFSALEELRRTGKKFTGLEFEKILISIVKISNKVEEDGVSFDFKNQNFDTGNWYWVLNSVSGLIESTINDLDENSFKILRPNLINVITYLLGIKGSPDEKNEEYIRDPKTGNSPYNEAINSVRGKAYTSFIFLCSKDGEMLLDDTKVIFLNLIENERSTPVKFLIGYYLFYLYIRDKDFVLDIKNKIFSNAYDDNFACLEGYLTSNLHPEMFRDFESIYTNILSRKDLVIPLRTYTKDINEGIAEHLALSYLYFDESKEKQDLLDLFWSNKNTKQCTHFINFVGRTVINSEDALSIIKNNNLMPKLKSLIDLVLSLDLTDAVYSGFGFWINKDREVLDDSYIIEKFSLILSKSNGAIDWDYAFIQRLTTFAEKDPKNTLSAIKNYFIDRSGNLSNHRLFPIYISEEKDALEIIYNKGGHEDEIKLLISILIEKGGSNFWQLKNVLGK